MDAGEQAKSPDAEEAPAEQHDEEPAGSHPTVQQRTAYTVEDEELA